MNYFYEKYPQYADKVACINLDMSGTGEEYPNKIKQLYKQGGDTVPSLVVADADVLHNFVEEHDFYVPMSDLGITAGDYANAYAYTVDYATIDNKLIPGPTNYFWSGSYLMATDAGLKSDVTEGVLEALCCNESMMEGYYWSYDFPNNKKSVENLISYGDDLGMEKLGGQNPLPVYDQVAKNIQISGVAPDQTTYGYYVEAACQWYNEGTVNSINEAIGYIKEQVSESHPNITITD